MIAFDIDGVVVDVYDSVHREIRRRTGLSETYCEPSYDFYLDYGLTHEDFMEAFSHLVMTHKFKPMKNSFRVLKKYADKTGMIYFITNRPEHLIPYTREWFLEYRACFPFEIVNVDGSKTEAARKIGCDGIVDDHMDNVRDFVNSGMKGFLFFQPWHTFYDLSGLNVVNSWSELAEILGV